MNHTLKEQPATIYLRWPVPTAPHTGLWDREGTVGTLGEGFLHLSHRDTGGTETCHPVSQAHWPSPARKDAAQETCFCLTVTSEAPGGSEGPQQQQILFPLSPPATPPARKKEAHSHPLACLPAGSGGLPLRPSPPQGRGHSVVSHSAPTCLRPHSCFFPFWYKFKHHRNSLKTSLPCWFLGGSHQPV